MTFPSQPKYPFISCQRSSHDSLSPSTRETLESFPWIFTNQVKISWSSFLKIRYSQAWLSNLVSSPTSWKLVESSPSSGACSGSHWLTCSPPPDSQCLSLPPSLVGCTPPRPSSYQAPSCPVLTGKPGLSGRRATPRSHWPAPCL